MGRPCASLVYDIQAVEAGLEGPGLQRPVGPQSELGLQQALSQSKRGGRQSSGFVSGGAIDTRC